MEDGVIEKLIEELKELVRRWKREWQNGLITNPGICLADLNRFIEEKEVEIG